LQLEVLSKLIKFTKSYHKTGKKNKWPSEDWLYSLVCTAYAQLLLGM
jgi:hypothetical protein